MGEVEILICDIPVNFPFKPYSVQVDYMQSLITCLNEKRHGVLESPTGTGKTLSLLCGSLAWLNHYKLKKRYANNDSQSNENIDDSWGGHTPKLIYASRTHSQLKQVIKQFYSTVYKHIFRPTVIGSRDHMCVNHIVKKEESLSAKNVLCSSFVKQRRCHYYNNVKNNSLLSDFNPIEELDKPSEKVKCCPYYACREIIPSSDIIFMPYNYLLDPQTQKSFKFNLSETIIIIDEGHNIAKICEEAASVTVTSTTVACALVDIKEEMQSYYDDAISGSSDNERDYTTDDLVFLHQIFSKFEEILQGIEITEAGKVFQGSYIFKLLSDSNIIVDNYQRVIELLQSISDNILMRNERLNISSSTKGANLRKFADSLFSIYSTYSLTNSIDANFKVFVEYETNTSSKWTNKPKSKKINYWCFNPSVSLNKLFDYQIRSIILTSGTLSPLDATINELSLQNPVTVENNHIINPNQILLSVVSRGPTNTELKSTYENRENEKFWNELGMTIENMSRHIPDGLLIFFPSYVTMNKASEFWKNSGLLKRISLIKPVFIEPNKKDLMEEMMRDYSIAIESSKNGAILFAVCRGKISEGLDFSGKYARGVIITGIPYAPLYDQKVKLKKQFIDLNKKSLKGLSGEGWYHMDAMRAVNQAVGRVIRNSSDYGVILLCDSRFERSQNYLPKWLRSKLTVSTSFGNAIVKLRSFFKAISDSKPVILKARGRRVKEISLIRDTESTREDNVGSDPLKTEEFKQESDAATVNSIVPNDSYNQPCCSTQIMSKPSVSEELEKNIKSELSAKQELINENIPKNPRDLKTIPFSSVVQKAEETFKQKLMFNPTVLETYIGPETEIHVQPAKKRKIKIVPPDSGNISDLRKRSEIKSFIIDVKFTLDAESYTTFAFIVKKYQANNNFDEALLSLVKLFLTGEETFSDIFKGCVRLFSEGHKIKFEDYVSKNT